MLDYNKKLVSISKTLRKNMTPEEKRLWYDFLKYLPFTVRRQHVIDEYIVDFYVAEKNTVIEIDGSQHSEPDNVIADENRDKHLSELGIDVLRYPNDSIHKNFQLVCNDIMQRFGITDDDLL